MQNTHLRLERVITLCRRSVLGTAALLGVELLSPTSRRGKLRLRCGHAGHMIIVVVSSIGVVIVIVHAVLDVAVTVLGRSSSDVGRSLCRRNITECPGALRVGPRTPTAKAWPGHGGSSLVIIATETKQSWQTRVTLEGGTLVP